MTQDKSYFQVTIQTKNLEDLEEIKKISIESGSEGLQEFVLEEFQVDELLGERAYSGGDIPQSVIDEVSQRANEEYPAKYVFFFTEEANAQTFVESISSFDLSEALLEKCGYEDWNAEWRKHYKTLDVASDFKVIPEWEKPENHRNVERDIFIYPGMGFGTGDHETTFLCLQLYREIWDQDFTECLDFGCGSGILGVASLKNSKSRVDFIDVDPEALDNCLQNLLLNFDESKLEGHSLVLRDRYQLRPRNYQLVFANILEAVLEAEQEIVVESVAQGGSLIVSGLLNPQVDNIVKLYTELGLKFVKTVSKGDWSAILFKRD